VFVTLERLMSALSSHPELRILLADVKAQPDEDTPRLILADWLQDQGDPRGELIHLQVVRARLTVDEPRHDELLRREWQILSRHALDWLGPLADLASGWEFLRGFIRLRARCRNFLVPAVYDLAADDQFAWVEGLALTRLLREHVGQLADSPLLARLVQLDLSDTSLGNGGLVRLLEAPDLVGLHTLRLAHTGLGERGAVALARCPRLQQLSVLDLRRNRSLGGGVFALADSPYLKHLTRLEVSSRGLSLAGLAVLREAFGNRVVLGGAGL
jgi:uncharacterized protein (TIGR02996 family)